MKNLRALRPQVLASAYSGFSIATEPSVNHRHPPRVPNLIGGAFVDSKSTATIDVINHWLQQSKLSHCGAIPQLQLISVSCSNSKSLFEETCEIRENSKM